jgi:branched-chain amino acid transport system ATP-binding protein
VSCVVVYSASGLTCVKVNAGYGSAQVVYDIDLRVQPGEICTIVGPNGSGKSTLLKTVFGMTKVYAGTIMLDDMDITSKPPHEVARIGVAYVPQTGNVFANLTGTENLVMACYSIPKSDVEGRMQKALEFLPQVKSFLDRKVITLSGGERQMLCITMALVRNPRIMMFDEPSSNLAPNMVSLVFDKIREINEDLGITVVLVEQNAKMALEMSDDAVLLASGRVLFSGESSRLLHHPELNKLYLGITAK